MLTKTEFVRKFGSVACDKLYGEYKASCLNGNGKHKSYPEYLQSREWHELKETKLKEAEYSSKKKESDDNSKVVEDALNDLPF